MSVAIFIGTVGTRAGGVETYEKDLIRAMAKLDQTTPFHLYCSHPQARGLIGVEQPNFRFTNLFPQFRPISYGVTLPAMLALARQERLLHATYVPPLFSPKPYLSTIHGSFSWEYAHLLPDGIRFRLNYLQEKAIRNARLLVCVSRYLKDFIAERFRVPEERLAVVYHGVASDFGLRPREEVLPLLKERYGIDYPYLLFTGKLMPFKNIVRLLDAFAHFRKRTGSPIRLVLAGRRLWPDKAFNDKIDEALATGSVTEVGHVMREDVPLLYNGCAGVVYPTVCEGFGMPALEALASGVPVLTGDSSSLPEVTGGYAFIADVLSVESLADGMERMIQDTPERRKMIAAGLERAREFTWVRTARETLAAYQRVLATI